MTYLPNDLLVKVDIATMAVSLEARSPFLDHHVIEFAASLPEKYKLRGITTKYLLKRVLKKLLPQENLNGRRWALVCRLDIGSVASCSHFCAKQCFPKRLLNVDSLNRKP